MPSPPEKPPGNASSTSANSVEWLLRDPGFVNLPQLKIRSRSEILLLSAGVAVGVFLLALGVQWVIYDRFLHDDGLRIVGSTIAALLAAILTERLESISRARSLQELRRLEMLAVINHHVRNALQAILCSDGYGESKAIQAAVDRIEWALREVLPYVQDLDQVEPSRTHARSA
ncbi:MAG TPA: hypothetical protein VGL89_10485 [Candidatus Koribacter sp.]|jgi:hypothetical protein